MYYYVLPSRATHVGHRSHVGDVSDIAHAVTELTAAGNWPRGSSLLKRAVSLLKLPQNIMFFGAIYVLALGSHSMFLRI